MRADGDGINIRDQAARQQMVMRMVRTMPTVRKMLGAEEVSSLCHSAMGELRSILPMACLGITFSLAFLEWLACSKASDAFLPALLSSTMGPPGCSLEYSVRSYTTSLITTHKSFSLLCFPTSSQLITLSLMLKNYNPPTPHSPPIQTYQSSRSGRVNENRLPSMSAPTAATQPPFLSSGRQKASSRGSSLRPKESRPSRGSNLSLTVSPGPQPRLKSAPSELEPLRSLPAEQKAQPSLRSEKAFLTLGISECLTMPILKQLPFRIFTSQQKDPLRSITRSPQLFLYTPTDVRTPTVPHLSSLYPRFLFRPLSSHDRYTKSFCININIHRPPPHFQSNPLIPFPFPIPTPPTTAHPHSTTPSPHHYSAVGRNNIIMRERGSLSNLDVADIYEHMLQGDKGGLAKLQQVNFKNQIPKFMESYNRQRAKLDTQEDKTNQESRQSEKPPSRGQKEPKETVSTAHLAAKKEHAFLNALKRGAKMGFLSKNQTRDIAQHRWVNSSNQNYQKDVSEHLGKKEAKRESKGIKKESSVDLKATATLDKPPVTKMYALPKVNKPKDSVQLIKAQSAHMETNKKTIFTDELERPKRDLKKRKVVDLQDVIGPSKKIRLDFEKKNEEERKLQVQIMEYHHSTKLFLADIKAKYSLSINHKAKYIKRKIKKVQTESPIKEMHTEEESPLKKTINEQNQHCNDIKEEINQLKILYNSNQAKIDKLSVSMERNPFSQYIIVKQNSIDEESEEDEDIVEPLQGLDQKNRYSHIMAQTREKKWGLMQRVEYETHRASTLEQSRHTAARSESRVFPERVSTEKRQEKVVINERLKNLLFS